MAKDKHELESMNKDELVSYASSIGADCQQSWLKEDIVSSILKSQKAAAKQKQSKEVGMNDEVEVKPVKVTGPINIKGRSYAAGDEVMLTEEEASQLAESGVCIEGVEPLTPEEVQAAHDEGVEAQKAEIEARAKAEAEQAARDEAYEDGEEFDEEEFNAEYDRQKKVANPEYETPEAKA